MSVATDKAEFAESHEKKCGGESIGAVMQDVERRLRAVESIERVLAQSSSTFCAMELSPLLQTRKRPLEETKRQCVALAEYGVEHNLW
jgi:hypothetical protein